MTPGTVETLLAGDDRCGEGPIWDPAARRLIWNDLGRSLVFEWKPGASQRSVISQGLMVSGIALHRDGGFVFAGSDGLFRWRSAADGQPLLTEHAGTKLCFNDVLADSQGRLYAGTYDWTGNTMNAPGRLYLIEPGPRATVLDEGILLANGLALSPDGRMLYFADSAARSIFTYERDPTTGRVGGRRTLVVFDIEDGVPDGLTTDSDGHLWIALWYGGQIVRCNPEGRVERRIVLPALQIASLTFGGDDYSDLFVTTGGEPWPSPLAPASFDPNSLGLGGSLYRVCAGVRGRPEFHCSL